MESPSVVVPPVAPLMLPPHPRGPSLMTLVLVSGALASLIVIIFFGQSVYPSIRVYGQWVPVYGNSGTEWYRFGIGSLTPTGGLQGFDDQPFVVTQAAPLEGTGDTVVLAQVPHQSGTVVGLIRPDGSFKPLVMDGSAKYDLAVRPDGLAVYTSAEIPRATASSTVVTEYDPVIVPDTVSLTQLNGAVQTRLKLIDVTGSSTPTDLGIGMSPRLTSAGIFVAITDEGLVSIDPVSKEKTTIVPIAVRTVRGTISNDAAYVVLPSGGQGLIMYSLDGSNPVKVSPIVSDPHLALLPGITMAGPTRLFLPMSTPRGTQITVYERVFNGPSFTRLGSVPLTLSSH